MRTTLSEIDAKISALKLKKEKIQTQEALLFLKASRGILGDHFTPEVALAVLAETWKMSSDIQKKEWIRTSHSFRTATQNPQQSLSQHAATPQ